MDPKEKVHEEVAKIVNILMLQHWVINVDFSYTPNPDDTESFTHDAEVIVYSAYLVATIKLYPDFLKLSDKEKRLTLIHELVHCIVQPYKDIIIDLDGTENHGIVHEQITSHLSHIINNLMKKE